MPRPLFRLGEVRSLRPSSLSSPCLKSRKDPLYELSPYDRLAKGYGAHRHDI